MSHFKRLYYVPIKFKALALAACLFPAAALANFEVYWQTPEGGSEELFAGALRDSNIIKDALKHAKLPLKWPKTVTFMMGGEGLPRFDAKKQTIHLPYDYLANAVQAQKNFEESRAVSLQRGLDVVEYTVYHLLGHALVGRGSHDVDVDETAEALATWLMVTGFQNGGEQWLDDVLFFGRASQRLDGPLEDYWHSHALTKRGEQRLNCLVVGSGPARYHERFPSLTESPEQGEACVEQWQELNTLIKMQYTQAAQ